MFFQNKNIFIDQIHHYDEKGQGKLNTNKCIVKIWILSEQTVNVIYFQILHLID